MAYIKFGSQKWLEQIELIWHVFKRERSFRNMLHRLKDLNYDGSSHIGGFTINVTQQPEINVNFSIDILRKARHGINKGGNRVVTLNFENGFGINEERLNDIFSLLQREVLLNRVYDS